MPSIEVKGADKFAELAAKIRKANGEMPEDLMRALEKTAPPLERAAKKSAAENLPKRGGLAAIVAGSGFTHQRRASGIRIVARGITQLKLTNDGKVRHPVYGEPGTWVGQAIPKATSWFTRPIMDGAPKIRDELSKAIEKVLREIA
jgi:hypothetical protein